MVAKNTNPDRLSREEWLKRKLERREKQRAANLGRAEKMRTARLTADRQLFPANHDIPRINIGCSGWFYWHWR